MGIARVLENVGLGGFVLLNVVMVMGVYVALVWKGLDDNAPERMFASAPERTSARDIAGGTVNTWTFHRCDEPEPDRASDQASVRILEFGGERSEFLLVVPGPSDGVPHPVARSESDEVHARSEKKLVSSHWVDCDASDSVRESEKRLATSSTDFAECGTTSMTMSATTTCGIEFDRTQSTGEREEDGTGIRERAAISVGTNS